MRLVKAVVMAAAMVATCVPAFAQAPSTRTVEVPPAPGFVVGGVVGGGPLMGVKGQPYSLVQKTTRVRTLSDGTVMTTHGELHLMRDWEGRTRTEMGTVKDGQFETQNIILMDPVARMSVMMSVNGKTAIVTHFPEPKPPTAEQKARMAEVHAKAEAYRKEHPAPPSSFEQLQPETIAGVYATGRRHTMTIPAGSEGNDRDIHVVEDSWASSELRVTMRSITDDPRMGKLTMEVTQLDRNEPDPTLFQIPADYKVTERGQ